MQPSLYVFAKVACGFSRPNNLLIEWVFIFYFLTDSCGIASIMFMIAWIINLLMKLGSLIYKCTNNILNYGTSSIGHFHSLWLNLLDSLLNYNSQRNKCLYKMFHTLLYTIFHLMFTLLYKHNGHYVKECRHY